MDAQLIVDAAGGGLWNMAVDEALLTQAAETGRAALRFYRWRLPTLSLGYFQPINDRNRHHASSQLPLVRRASGGGAIVHDNELTYCYAAPARRSGGSSQALYLDFHETLVETFREFGAEAVLCQENKRSDAFLCFQRRSVGDVLCGRNKVAGSAQRRRGEAILQHGSILLASSAHAPELPGLNELNCPLTSETLVDGWLPRIRRRLKVALSPTDLDDRQVELAEKLTSRLGQPEWIGRR